MFLSIPKHPISDASIHWILEQSFINQSIECDKHISEQNTNTLFPEEYTYDLTRKYSLDSVYDMLIEKFPRIFSKNYFIHTEYGFSDINDDNKTIKSFTCTDKKNFLIFLNLTTGGKHHDRVCINVNAIINNPDYDINTKVVGQLVANKLIECNTKIEASDFARVNIICQSGEGLSFRTLDIPVVDIQQENYEPEVYEAFSKMSDMLIAKEPRGKLHILNGVPGCGKTFIIRELCKRYKEAQFIIMKPDMVSSISGPQLMAFLLESSKVNKEKPIIFLIEDGDLCIEKRDANNISQISEILNLADGLIGSSLNTRIVITANLKTDQIDKAIFRVGRLGYHIQFNTLSSQQANKCLSKLVGIETKFFEKNATLAEIYDRARIIKDNVEEVNNGSQENNTRRAGFETE